jgi:hypothetical protein
MTEEMSGVTETRLDGSGVEGNVRDGTSLMAKVVDECGEV